MPNNNNGDMPVAPGLKVQSSVVKFFIGFFAGIVVITLPKVSTFLTQDSSGAVEFFTNQFLIILLVFALMLGVLITIFEYGEAKKPKEIFFSAIAIPGLIAGSYHTAMESSSAEDYATKLKQSTDELRMIKGKSPEPVRAEGFISQSNDMNEHGLLSGVSLITSAHAESPAEHSDGDKSDGDKELLQPVPSASKSAFDPTPTRMPAEYLISLGTYPTLEQARAAKQTLQSQLADVAILKTDKGYQLTSAKTPLTAPDATLEAIRLDENLNLDTKLIRLTR